MCIFLPCFRCTGERVEEKVNLIVDGKILISGLTKNTARSGIYFASFNIFKELLKSDKVNIILYVEGRNYLLLKEFLTQEFPKNKIKIISDIEGNNCISLWYLYLSAIKKRAKVAKQSIRKFLCILALLILKPLVKIFSKPLDIKRYGDNLCFLSLCFAVPEIFKNCRNYTILYDITPLVFPDYFPSDKVGFWFASLMDSLNAKAGYFAISEATKKDFLKVAPVLNEKQITTTLLACDDSFLPVDKALVEKVRAKYKIPEGKKYVFSLCSLEPRKNLLRAVKTFVQFLKKNDIDDLVFVLGGGQWDTFIAKLDAEIKNQEDYKDKIVKIGYVDDEDLAALYSGAEWFVYTSQYEGFGMPPLEAMSCGCPVISSNSSSLPEVVGDAGIMVDYDSDEQHIAAYEKYYFSEDLRKENAAKGLERAKNFSWEKTGKIILDKISV